MFDIFLVVLSQTDMISMMALVLVTLVMVQRGACKERS